MPNIAVYVTAGASQLALGYQMSVLVASSSNGATIGRRMTVAVNPPPCEDAVVVGTPPVINNFSPAVGSSIQPETVINFDIVDPDNFARILIVAAYGSGKRDVMHDGNAFAPFYAGSTRTPISGGFTYSFIRSGGWSEDPTITPYAIDSFGTENL